MTLTLVLSLALAATSATDAARKARDVQDLASLDKLAAEAEAKAQAAPADADAFYRVALTQSFRSEVALERSDKNAARAAAEAGIKAAEKAVALQANNAEYHRILGTLCGQVVPANLLLGLKYGRCALDQVNKALELDPKSSDAWLSHGVGNYYLPPSFGGGLELALKDFQKAIELNPKNSDAHLWLGLTLRKLNRVEEARRSLEQARQLNLGRVWTKQQLDKTPAK